MAATTNLSESDDSVIGLNFQNGSDEKSPGAAIGIAQRSFQGHGARVPGGAAQTVRRVAEFNLTEELLANYCVGVSGEMRE